MKIGEIERVGEREIAVPKLTPQQAPMEREPVPQHEVSHVKLSTRWSLSGAKRKSPPARSPRVSFCPSSSRISSRTTRFWPIAVKQPVH